MEPQNRIRPLALLLIALVAVAMLYIVAGRLSLMPGGERPTSVVGETPTNTVVVTGIEGESPTAGANPSSETPATPSPTTAGSHTVAPTDMPSPTRMDTPTAAGITRQAATATPTPGPSPTITPTSPPTATRVRSTPLTPPSLPETPVSILTRLPCIGIAFLHEGDLRCAVTNAFVEQFTLGANAYQFAWSPDGAALAVAVVLEGRSIILRALSNGTRVDILAEGFNPAWSRDGRWLTYQWGNQIWRTAADGGEAVQLTFEVDWHWSNPLFTGDGQAILVAGAPVDAVDGNGNVPFFFYTVPAGGGALIQLPGMTRAEEGGLPQDVEFSADGTRFAYTISHRQNPCLASDDIRSRRADGSDSRSLIPTPLHDAVQRGTRRFVHADAFAWSPVENEVALSASVFECPAAASAQPQIITERRVYVLDSLGNEVRSWRSEARDLGWHRRGIALVYERVESGVPGSVIYLSNADGSGVMRVEPGSSPRWKPS